MLLILTIIGVIAIISLVVILKNKKTSDEQPDIPTLPEQPEKPDMPEEPEEPDTPIQPEWTDRRRVSINIITKNLTPRAATCLSKIKTSRTERLVMGINERENGMEEKDTTEIYQWWPGCTSAQSLKTLRFETPGYHAHSGEIMADIFTNPENTIVNCIPESDGQGCKHFLIHIDEDCGVTGVEQYSYEKNGQTPEGITGADHDRIDWGAGRRCIRTNRMLISYGNNQSREGGKYLRGLLLEYDGPTPGKWDSWTNRLPGYPRAFVILGNDKNSPILVSCTAKNRDRRENEGPNAPELYFPDKGANDNVTHLVLVESRPFDGELIPNGGHRCPQKEGYWKILKTMYGWGWVIDTYNAETLENMFIFVTEADSGIYWGTFENPVDIKRAQMLDGAGNFAGGNSPGYAPGNAWGHALHPKTNRLIIANANMFLNPPTDKGLIVWYEVLYIDGEVKCREIINLHHKGEWNINGVDAFNSTFWTTGDGTRNLGEKAPGCLFELKIS